MKTKVRSAEWGANEQRKTIKRKIREMMAEAGTPHIDGRILLDFIKFSDERYQRRKGGLGR